MIQQPIPPSELESQIRSRHVYFISEIEMRCLAAMELGYTNGEIAGGLGVAPSTVRRHVAELVHKVFDPTEIHGDRDKLRTWAARQFECCTRGAQEMIAGARIFG
jgi:predicted transcriptional regulator